MSILNTRFQGKDADGKEPPAELRGLGLHQLGPMVQVTLSLTDDHRQVLSDSGEVLPAPVPGYALIDTGAGATCFDQEAAQKAKLTVAGSTHMASATGSEIVPVYTGQLKIAGFTNITAEAALGAKLEALGLIALIGRDVLANCILVYNGPESAFTLSH